MTVPVISNYALNDPFVIQFLSYLSYCSRYSEKFE